MSTDHDRNETVLENLKKEIKEKRVRKLYLFYGQEEYLKKRYLNDIEGLVVPGEFKEWNKIVFEGKTSLAGLVESCETMPVFSERKLVVVRNSGWFMPGGKETVKTEKLIQFLCRVPDHTCLVFVEEDADGRLKTLLDTVKKHGLAVKFDYRKPADLEKWLEKKVFLPRGKEISPRAAAMLVEACGPEMTYLFNEAEKVIAYLGDRKKAGPEDIEKVCTKSIKGRIFDLTDAIASKNGWKALRLFDDLLALKEPITLILFMIVRQLTQILDAGLMISEGMKSGDIAKRLGVQPYIAEKIIRQAKAFPADRMKKVVGECFKLDEAVKNGLIDGRIAIELLIADLTK